MKTGNLKGADSSQECALYNLKLINEKRKIFHIDSEGYFWYTIRSSSWKTLIAELFSVTLIFTTAP